MLIVPSTVFSERPDRAGTNLEILEMCPAHVGLVAFAFSPKEQGPVLKTEKLLNDIHFPAVGHRQDHILGITVRKLGQK